MTLRMQSTRHVSALGRQWFAGINLEVGKRNLVGAFEGRIGHVRTDAALRMLLNADNICAFYMIGLLYQG
jgi:hypothetical protein